MDDRAPEGDAESRQPALSGLDQIPQAESSRAGLEIGQQPPRLGDLSVKAVFQDGGMTGRALEAVFQADSDLMGVLISDPAEPTRVGLITRLSFYEAMTGRLGFGRHLQAQRAVTALAFWDPLAMPHDTTLDDVSAVLLARPEEKRGRDLLVSWPDGSFGTVSVSSVFEGLAMKYGYEATHDILTGLPNRVLLIDRLTVMLRHTDRVHLMVAVLFCDLDGFKRINDSLGHQFGDRVLNEVAGRFASTVRAADTLARLGGDEFVVACEFEGEHVPLQLAERLIASLSTPIALDGHRVRIATSVGVAVADGKTSGPEELLRNADLAMYRAKTQGRGGFEMFDTAMHARALERLTLEQALGPAMGRDEFRLFYQPLVRASDRGLIGFEALLRWQLPSGRMVAPSDFIGVAEESGFILTIGAWVLGEACRQLAEWRSEGAGNFKVGVNVSARQFVDPGLLGYVESTLEACRLDPTALVLEITETTLMQHVKSSLEMLAALRRLGVGISVDDFGTGYSSLAYLATIPLDSLKIDKSFVAELESKHTSRTLARTVINLARELGVRSIAEGVETERQFTILQDMGCDVIQGYLIGRPEPPTVTAETWLSATLPA